MRPGFLTWYVTNYQTVGTESVMSSGFPLENFLKS